MSQIRKVTKRDKFQAQHFELDLSNDLVIQTNNRIRASRALDLPTKRRLVAAAPSFVAGWGSLK